MKKVGRQEKLGGLGPISQGAKGMKVKMHSVVCVCAKKGYRS